MESSLLPRAATDEVEAANVVRFDKNLRCSFDVRDFAAWMSPATGLDDRSLWLLAHLRTNVVRKSRKPFPSGWKPNSDRVQLLRQKQAREFLNGPEALIGCVSSIALLAAVARLSRDTVRKCLENLEKLGFVKSFEVPASKEHFYATGSLSCDQKYPYKYFNTSISWALRVEGESAPYVQLSNRFLWMLENYSAQGRFKTSKCRVLRGLLNARIMTNRKCVPAEFRPSGLSFGGTQRRIASLWGLTLSDLKDVLHDLRSAGFLKQQRDKSGPRERWRYDPQTYVLGRHAVTPKGLRVREHFSTDVLNKWLQAVEPGKFAERPQGIRSALDYLDDPPTQEAV